MKRTLSLLIVSLSLSLHMACSLKERPVSQNNGFGTQSPDPPSPDAGESEKPMEYASGWTEVTLNSGYGKTTVDITGHYLVSRNACFKEEAGALSLEIWNQFAHATNVATRTELLTEPFCFDIEWSRYSLDGTVEIKIAASDKKRMIFEARGGGRICTPLPERVAPRQFLDLINRILALSQLEGCSNVPY